MYDEMVAARIAICLEKKVFLDAQGKEVPEKEAYGLAVDTKLIHPNYLIFADKTGCNTSQKKDGHTAGTKSVVEKGKVSKICFIMLLTNTQ